MLRIIFRFIIVYFFMLISMKILGKRQIGEMQMSELVGAFFLSELATYSVTDASLPLLYTMVPIALMIILEITISLLAVKIPLMKRLFDFSPSILVRESEVLQKELLKNRLTTDELFSMLRIAGYYDIEKVRFAILEPNGQLSVIPYARHDSVSCDDLDLSPDEKGFSVALINDGRINSKGMRAIGKNENWLRKALNRSKISSEKEVFLMISDFNGNFKIFKKEKS